MSLRRMLITVPLVCGLCVWGLARSGDESVAAQGAATVEAGDEGDNHDEAAARYRTNQARNWRQVAVGSCTSH